MALTEADIQHPRRRAATDSDRQALIGALEYAYVHDVLTAEELADRVAWAYASRTLDELDAVLRRGSAAGRIRQPFGTR